MSSGNIIDLKQLCNDYRFITVPVWIKWGTKNNGEIIKKQHAMIGLKSINLDVQIIHPVSEIIVKEWIGSKYNTQRKHSNNIVKFLNYILKHTSELKVTKMQDLKLEHATIFLNWLTIEGNSRGSVKQYERTLTRFYLWLSKKRVITDISPHEFVKVKGTYCTYYESPFEGVHFPSNQPVKTEHMLPVKYIPLLLEVAVLFATPIALGLYMQIFGGLRVGELMNLKRTSTLRQFKNRNFLVKLDSLNLRTDIKNSSGSNYTKKSRKQVILQINDWGNILFNDHVKLYKDTDKSGALFVNRDGKAMIASSYRQYFKKVKEKFIKVLQMYGSPQDKILAHHLNMANWSSHIGRGTFTNLLADEVDNPFDLAFLRGDSNLLSSLVYMVNTERMRVKVENKFKDMHNEYIPRLIKRKQIDS